MQSSGDPGMPLFWYPSQNMAIDSMTVIISTFTPEGFVIGADGRQVGAQDKCILSEHRQKIFPIESPNGPLAYAISGTIDLATHDRTGIALNMADEVKKATESLARKRTSSLFGYAVRLCRPIQDALKNARQSGRIHDYPSHERAVSERGKTITRVLIDGYRGQEPCRVSIRFFHEEQRLHEPEILVPPLNPGSHRIYGSDVIVNLLWKSEDPRFAKYRGPSILAKDMTLKNAIKRSADYIGACCDPEAVGADDYCYFMGGHIHIATITPAEGFQWVPGYEPLSSG
ncbi:MAG: hypothetical protein ACJ74Z_09330 [Bryobacteraceae bacterium]